jgi:hypothetical protein
VFIFLAMREYLQTRSYSTLYDRVAGNQMKVRQKTVCFVCFVCFYGPVAGRVQSSARRCPSRLGQKGKSVCLVLFVFGRCFLTSFLVAGCVLCDSHSLRHLYDVRRHTSLLQLVRAPFVFVLYLFQFKTKVFARSFHFDDDFDERLQRQLFLQSSVSAGRGRRGQKEITTPSKQHANKNRTVCV